MRFLSTRTHAIMGILVSIVLFFAPNIFGFSDNGGAAVAIPRILAIVLLLSELTTNNGLAPLKLVPMKMHLMMDIAVGAFLALSPWLFGFHDQGTNAWVPHVVVGLMYIGTSLMTQTEPEADRSHNKASA